MSELLWHHGNISKAEAVRRFRQFHPDGSFLVRNSGTVMNAFVLSLGFQNYVYHYRIVQDTSKRYIFENRIFYSLSEFVDYYGKNQGCLVCTLRHPVLPPLPIGLGASNEYDEPAPVTNGLTSLADRGYDQFRSNECWASLGQGVLSRYTDFPAPTIQVISTSKE